jgi:cell division protein FtsL
MAYTRGNLAVQPKRKEEVESLYRQKTKVVTRRMVLPLREKLLYMLTLTIFVLVAGTLVWRYLHIYDLNKQVQQIDEVISKSNKQIAVYQMEKQKLEQLVAVKAKSWGFDEPSEDIYVPKTDISTGSGDN